MGLENEKSLALVEAFHSARLANDFYSLIPKKLSSAAEVTTATAV